MKLNKIGDRLRIRKGLHSLTKFTIPKVCGLREYAQRRYINKFVAC